MRPLATLLGTLLLSLGLAGLVTLGLGPRHSVQLELTRLAARLGLIALPLAPAGTPLTAEEIAQLAPLHSLAGTDANAVPPASSAPAAPPSRLRVPSINLDAEVVTAQLIRLQSAITWEVPAHRVGHAQGTANAGGTGNMVLLGHVSSINAGNVFAALDRLAIGDDITVTDATTATHDYRVTEVRRVLRDDTSVMAPAEGSVATLITCTGAWLPDAHDFSHRLAVRAALVR